MMELLYFLIGLLTGVMLGWALKKDHVNSLKKRLY
jgi:hypothetical protein